MIGIAVAAKKEWEAVLNYFNIEENKINLFPFGEYFNIILNDKELLFFRCGVRKVCSSASVQHMIDKFNLNKVIQIGTCAGIDDKYKPLDIFIPNKAVQYDCTVKETEPLIKESFIVNFDLSKYNFNFNTGTIGTSDKPVVMWKDYMELKNNDITIADTEAGAIAYVCKMNNVECLIVKGISDFPTNEAETSKEESHGEQLNIFITNIPLVMNKIFDEYLKQIL